MKKGLRLPCLPIVAAMAIPTADLMKKGLRQEALAVPRRSFNSNRRPDEEGIKTRTGRQHRMNREIPTADLMKKGLRRRAQRESETALNSNRRPDEEGIKTGGAGRPAPQLQFQPQT